MKPSLLSGAILLALATSAGYHILHLPTQKKLAQLNLQLDEAQKTQDLRMTVARLMVAHEAFQKELSPKPETEWLVREVNRLAEEAQIKPPISLAPQRPSRLEDLTAFAVSVEFDATYHQLGHFISSVERAPSFLRVEDLQIVPIENEVSRVRLTVSTFYLPPMTGLVVTE